VFRGVRGGIFHKIRRRKKVIVRKVG